MSGVSGENRVLTHRRSPESLLRRQVRGLIFRTSFQDKIRSETVCILSKTDILGQVAGPIQVCLVPDVEKGEVLIDSRGQGSFQ